MSLLLSGGIEDPEKTKLREAAIAMAKHIDQQDAVIADLRKQVAAMEPLKKLLKPQFDVMKRIFDMMDEAGVGEVAAPSNSKWDAIKQRLSGKQREFVDVLLIQGPMTVSNLAAANKCSGEAARQTVDKLRHQGLVEKNGKLVVLRS